MKLSDLWNWRCKIDRWAYLEWGLLLMLAKLGLDFIVSPLVFGQPWSVRLYLYPSAYLDPSMSAGVSSMQRGQFLMWMTVIGLPFAIVGLGLTVRRLRAVGLPIWLVVLFFPSILNLLFFILLCVARDVTAAPPTALRGNRISQWMPENALGSAVLAIFVTGGLGVSLTYLGTEIFGTYAFAMFLATPFALGLISALVHGARRPRKFAECLTVTLISVLFTGALLLVLAFEGAICLIMALPLILPLAILGCVVGYEIQKEIKAGRSIPPTIASMAIALPLLMQLEHAQPPEASLLQVKSAVEIAAPPERVWQNVIQFSELPPPTERLFHTGIAYPIRARIYGHGVGAVRYCMFSTGSFVEPIEVWDEPHLLRFGVTQNPAPMQEWSPYPNLQTPHLDGYFVSEHGQFLLTALPNGHTLLEGTTWYRNSLWPETYWRHWSDYIIHRIHLRVLNFIKSESEKETVAARQ